MQHQRIYSLDTAKGFAILLVMAIHSHFDPAPIECVLAVPTFFVVSGALMFPDAGLRSFVLKKARRLVLPYIFYTLLFDLFCLWTFEIPATPRGILNTLITGTNHPLWYLKAVFWTFLFERILMSLGAFASMRRMAVVLILQCIAGMATYSLVDNVFLTDITRLAEGIYYAPLLTAGHMLVRAGAIPALRTPSWRLLCAGALLLFAGVLLVPRMWLHVSISDGVAWLYYLACLTAIPGLILLCEAVRRNPILEYFGRHSMGYLCVHYLPVRLATVCWPDLNPWLLFPLTLAVSTLILLPLSRIPALSRRNFA